MNERMACSASVLWTVKQFIQNVKFPTYLTDSTCNHLYSLEVKGIVYLKAQSLLHASCMAASWYANTTLSRTVGACQSHPPHLSVSSQMFYPVGGVGNTRKFVVI